MLTASHLTHGAKLGIEAVEGLMTLTMLSSNASQRLEWFAVHTWSRHEKSVAQQLRGKQVEVFLPLYHTAKRWKNGKLSGKEPLFPGYLFVRIARGSQLAVLQTSGVARIVAYGKMLVALPDHDIIQLQTAIAKGIALSPHCCLAVGDCVRVRRGPFSGMAGILIRGKQGVRFVLSVELISRSISVELDIADLEPVLSLPSDRANKAIGRQAVPIYGVHQAG
jgi:transcription antitermination factor NusG